MKLTILLTFFVIIDFSNIKKSPDYFDSELSNIVGKFKSDIMDKEECEKQKRAAEDLANEIEDAIKNVHDYNSSEIAELSKLQKEAEAVEEFIASVGNCGNYMSSLNNFDLANRRVGANVASVIKDKYCVDVISVSIGGYVAYLAQNNTSKIYDVSYMWKAPNKINSGSGTMGLFKFSIRHIYDNRNNPSQKNVSVFGITCREY